MRHNSTFNNNNNEKKKKKTKKKIIARLSHRKSSIQKNKLINIEISKEY